MPSFNRNDVVTLTLDSDDSILFTGTAKFSVTPSGGTTQSGYISGTSQPLGPFGAAVTLVLTCDTSGSYTQVSSPASILTDAQISNTKIKGVAGADDNGGIYDSNGKLAVPSDLMKSFNAGRFYGDPIPRAASIYNRSNTARQQMTYTPAGQPASGKRRMVCYLFKKIGSGTYTSLQLMINNFFFNVSAQGGRGVATGNSFTVISASAQRNFAGATVTQMTKGGLSTFVVNDGEKDVLFDEIPGSFPIDQEWWFRIEIEVDYGQYIPVMEVNDTSYGNLAWIFDPAINTWNKTETQYPTYPQWSTGSMGNTVQVIGFSGILLGKFARGQDPVTIWAAGDSLINNGNDGSGQTSYFVRMCELNKISNVLTGRIGGQFDIVTANDFATHMVKYASYGLENFGTNSDGDSIGTLQSKCLSTWQAIRLAAARSPGNNPFGIMRPYTLVRTNAGNTTTLNNSWRAGGVMELLNTWFETQKGVGNGPDIVYDPTLGPNPANDLRKSRDGKGTIGSDYYLWANATHNGDGTHLGSAGATKAANNSTPNLPVFV